MRHLKMPVEGCRIIIQGFGNVGSNAAELLAEVGCKIIGIAEYDGGLYNANGMDIHALKPAPATSWDDCWVPGSGGGGVGGVDFDAVRDFDSGGDGERDHQPQRRENFCADCVRGANGPTTAFADDILKEKGDFIIPDILANAGGVTASYFEWVQDRQGYFWREEVVNERLDEILVKEL